MVNPLPKSSPRTNAVSRCAFTLIEILIVVIILGILAAIVIPQFTNAAQSARETTLKELTRHLRTQLLMYKNQHRDVSPGRTYGSDSASEVAFVEQMTSYSNEDGDTRSEASAVFHYGPYIEKMPVNPMSNLATIKLVSDGQPIPAADNTTGWLYKPETTELVPNTSGNDAAGIAFTAY